MRVPLFCETKAVGEEHNYYYYVNPTARSFATSPQMSFSSEAKNLFADSPLEDDRRLA